MSTYRVKTHDATLDVIRLELEEMILSGALETSDLLIEDGGASCELGEHPEFGALFDRARAARAAAPDVDALVGAEIAGYKLTKRIGHGGMAVIYRGENLLRRSIKCAIKVIRPEHANKREFVSRFLEEAEILERLIHPNIVRFHGVRQDSGLLVMELELLEGIPLDKWREARSQLDHAHGVRLIRDAARGVAAAHDLGIVHRDLKPENLFLCETSPEGEELIKVLDFGIARAVDDADRVSKITREGTAPGSPAYMAPEVCAGAVPDERADVYALGLCLYELLVGHHPFGLDPTTSKARRLNSLQLMRAHADEGVPPLGTFAPNAPPALEGILEIATARDPSERYKDAAAFADALDALDLSDEDASASRTEFALPTFSRKDAHDTSDEEKVITVDPLTPEQRTRRKRITWSALAIVALGAVAGVGYALYEPPPDPAVGFAVALGARDLNAAIAAATEAKLEREDTLRHENRFILIESSGGHGPRLGIEASKLNLDIKNNQEHQDIYDTLSGFRPERDVRMPPFSYEIQQHEVTWRDVDAWAESTTRPVAISYPSWLPKSREERADYPATGLTWSDARAYCKSIGADLPTEEQWEFAGRGRALNVFPWGNSPPDPSQLHLARHEGKWVRPVKQSPQDRTMTPDPERAIHDMMGNAMEWTVDIWRPDELGEQGSFQNFRAVRGYLQDPSLPPFSARAPREGLSYRFKLGATKAFEEASARFRERIGFRCARLVAREK